MNAPTPPAAVLFDRDGTLVVDVPYCADPRLVRPMPTARQALDRLRAARIPTGVATNQSGIGRGILTRAAADAVNAEVDRLLGPFDVWRTCPHAPGDGCACRKPRPGMLLDAAAELGVEPSRLAFVGDIGADVEAALAVGATAVLVPTAVTRPEEIRAAPVVRRTLRDAVDYLLAGTAVEAA
jgi:D-glycero-D-manno-heptose 1,7-bisphosphate phosphatase